MVCGDPLDQERTIARAIAVAVNYFDTAVQYGSGESEKNLGRILQKKGSSQPTAVGTKVLADPSVVQGFLDFAGAWNPALLFVIGAGLTVTLIGYRLIFRRGRPLWAPRFNLPTSTAIDTSLIFGAVIFGVGWGLAGYCPGPAVGPSPASERKSLSLSSLPRWLRE
jgi:hypothetical protein